MSEGGMDDARRVRRKFIGIQLVGNLLGAFLTFLYFRVIDVAPLRPTAPFATWEIGYFVAGFGLLGVIGRALTTRWVRPLVRAGERPPPAIDAALVRRRALLLPYMFAGITLIGWALAGVIWGLVWPLLAGVFSPLASLNAMFGITCIAGTVTSAFIFFSIEHSWRQRLPSLFPEGDLSAVPGVVRLPVQARLLVMFLMISIVPLSVLGVVSYTRAAASLHADPATASQLVGGTLVLIVFIVAVGTAAAAGLSVFVARSVAGPLRELQEAMAEVAQGTLDVRCPVVSNDEIGALGEGFNRMLRGLREREFLKEHRQRRASLLRAGRRSGQPGLTDPGPHQGRRHRHPGQCEHPPPARRRVRPGALAGGAREGQVGGGGGVPARVTFPRAAREPLTRIVSLLE